MFAVRAAIAVGVRDAIDLAGEGLEFGLVGMSFAGERETEQGAAVEGVFEANHSGTLGVSTGDLDHILDGFRAGIDEKGLLGEVAGADAVHTLGQGNVVFIRRDLSASVQEPVYLLMNRRGDGGMAMSRIEAANAAGEVDEDVAVNVFNQRALSLVDVDMGGVREATRHSLLTTRMQLVRTWARDWCA